MSELESHRRSDKDEEKWSKMIVGTFTLKRTQSKHNTSMSMQHFLNTPCPPHAHASSAFIHSTLLARNETRKRWIKEKKKKKWRKRKRSKTDETIEKWMRSILFVSKSLLSSPSARARNEPGTGGYASTLFGQTEKQYRWEGRRKLSSIYIFPHSLTCVRSCLRVRVRFQCLSLASPLKWRENEQNECRMSNKKQMKEREKLCQWEELLCICTSLNRINNFGSKPMLRNGRIKLLDSSWDRTPHFESWRPKESRLFAVAFVHVFSSKLRIGRRCARTRLSTVVNWLSVHKRCLNQCQTI